ncbi:MAG: class I SAM-dependent methyltransferase [Desulfobaccales bacterium]
MAFLLSMLAEVPPRKKTTAYWDAQARWQQIWLAHNDYHREILAFLTPRVQPGWRVLDIGAGSGVLSLPLQKLGCQVMALEPSRGMLTLLWAESRHFQILPDHIDPRRWEEVQVKELEDFDLILACNSLHLTNLNFQEALAKLFAPKPQHVCVISEVGFPEINLLANYDGYRLSHHKYFLADSSYSYRHLSEACEHLAHRLGRTPTPQERAEMRDKLIQRNNRLWLEALSNVGIFWWDKACE